METILNNLAETITNQWLAFTLIIIVSILYLFKQPLTELIKPKTKVKRKVIADLLDHDIFVTLERVNVEVNNSKFYTHGKFDSTKTKMCNDFAKYKTKIVKHGIITMLAQENLEGMSADKLKKTVLTLQNQWHIDYITEIRE